MQSNDAMKMIDPDEFSHAMFSLFHLVETLKMMQGVIPDKDRVMLHAINTSELFLAKMGGNAPRSHSPTACYVGTPEIKLDDEGGQATLYLNDTALSSVSLEDEKGVAILREMAQSLSQVFGLKSVENDAPVEMQDDLFDMMAVDYGCTPEVEPSGKEESESIEILSPSM